ncbi:hypothetical protein ACFXO9_27870 [Nocardia tengchongensis]|uniref:hypothetical protein n=1 Tax=Nocardia tengchongensis TaxID=2055889 RepID=UPI0036B53E43
MAHELGPRLAEQDFAASPALDGGDSPDFEEESLWFARSAPAVPKLKIAVDCLFSPLKTWVGMRAYARLISPEVGEVVRALPESAWLTDNHPGRESSRHGQIELTIFDEYIRGGWYGPADLGDKDNGFGDDQDVARAAEWVMDCLRGPVGEWLSRRDSLPKLIDLAKHMEPEIVHHRPCPRAHRLRMIAILCALNERPADAADLVAWYLRGGRFDQFDSFERATAFDIALRERFPEYADARAEPA